jgi:hypothetical protein
MTHAAPRALQQSRLWCVLRPRLQHLAQQWQQRLLLLLLLLLLQAIWVGANACC